MCPPPLCHHRQQIQQEVVAMLRSPRCRPIPRFRPRRVVRAAHKIAHCRDYGCIWLVPQLPKSLRNTTLASRAETPRQAWIRMSMLMWTTRMIAARCSFITLYNQLFHRVWTAFCRHRLISYDYHLQLFRRSPHFIQTLTVSVITVLGNRPFERANASTLTTLAVAACP